MKLFCDWLTYLHLRFLEGPSTLKMHFTPSSRFYFSRTQAKTWNSALLNWLFLRSTVSLQPVHTKRELPHQADTVGFPVSLDSCLPPLGAFSVFLIPDHLSSSDIFPLGLPVFCDEFHLLLVQPFNYTFLLTFNATFQLWGRHCFLPFGWNFACQFFSIPPFVTQSDLLFGCWDQWPQQGLQYNREERSIQTWGGGGAELIWWKIFWVDQCGEANLGVVSSLSR